MWALINFFWASGDNQKLFVYIKPVQAVKLNVLFVKSPPQRSALPSALSPITKTAQVRLPRKPANPSQKVPLRDGPTLAKNRQIIQVPGGRANSRSLRYQSPRVETVVLFEMWKLPLESYYLSVLSDLCSQVKVNELDKYGPTLRKASVAEGQPAE